MDSKKKVLIITDLEADDYLAIFLALCFTDFYDFTILVSGWTNPEEKPSNRQMGEQFVQMVSPRACAKQLIEDSVCQILDRPIITRL